MVKIVDFFQIKSINLKQVIFTMVTTSTVCSVLVTNYLQLGVYSHIEAVSPNDMQDSLKEIYESYMNIKAGLKKRYLIMMVIAI